MSIKTQVKYDLKKDTYNIVSEAKKEGINEIIENVLRAQMNQGSDKRPPIEKDIYTITIILELSNDTFKVSSDTGNKSLTAGILMQLFRELKKEKTEKVFYG